MCVQTTTTMFCEEVETTTHSMMICRRRFRLPPSGPNGREAWSMPGPKILLSLLSFSILFNVAAAGVPRFFESNRMAVVLLPGDTEVDSVIYRLRAEDADRNYPLRFNIGGTIGLNIIYIEPHDCTPSNDIFCEADVYLRNPLEIGRLYIFNLTVSDQRGYSTAVTARIDATNGRTTPSSAIFVSYKNTISIREDTPAKTIISQMKVRKKKHSIFGEFQVLGLSTRMFRMQASNLLENDLINGTLVLEKEADYEDANLHIFKVCILQPFTNEIVDTRNIACVMISVSLIDVQDEPPVFTMAPPVTKVDASAEAGDEVAIVAAKDGDRGTARAIRYSILPETSLYTKFFRMDSKTGVITMNESALNLREKMISLDPILMTVTAEEVTNRSDNFPAMSTKVLIAFVILDSEFLNPKFVHDTYVGSIEENAIPDAEVQFNSPFLVKDVKGLFALELHGDHGAFAVVPSVVKDASDIHIRVKNSFLLDYEKDQQISFKLIARQVRGLTQASSTTDITVQIIDRNDNPPVFSEPTYEVEILENISRGTSVIRVYATDKDSGTFGTIRYTDLFGPGAGSLQLEPTTGMIRCMTDNHPFDREEAAEYILTVEAKDNNGQGSGVNSATAKIIIRMKDVNDSPPRFSESIYKGVMTPDLQRLRDPIRIKAVDADADRPNNEIIYDIERSSYSDYFTIDRRTGVLDVRQNFLPRAAGLNAKVKTRVERALHENDTVISLRVKATDLGDPPLSEWVDVKIFKQEYGERVIRFIYSKSADEVRRDRQQLEESLNVLTGGTTEILNVVPLKGGILGELLDPTKSDVTALVRFGLTTTIDMEQVMSQLRSGEITRCQAITSENKVEITSLEGQNSSYLVGVVFLCIILALIIIIIVICCCCEGCPLFRNNQKGNMIADDGSEGVSYVRVDENGKYRGNSEDPSWWLAMPYFMKELFLACGYTPPGRSRSRLAWSAGERQKYGHIAQGAERGVEDPRGGMVQPLHRPRDAMQLEDLDASRMNRQAIGRQPLRVESRTSHVSSEQQPRRVFVLKDTHGVARGEEDLRQGNTYLLEDLEDDATRRTVQYDDDLMYQQGNSQVLRLHANPHDAAYSDQRHGGRVGMETEGAVYDEGGGGHVGRFVNGQPNGKYYESPSHIKLRGISDEEQSNGLSSNRSTFRDKIRNKLKLTHQHSTEAQQIDRATEPLDANSKSARSNNIPGTFGYQHTKTSILRYESTQAKIEEGKEDLIRQGKDPADDLCLQHQGGSLSESRKGSVKEGRTSTRNENARGKFAMPERRNSLPDVETNLEREAARRQIRKSSEGGAEFRDEEDLRGDVDYDVDGETSEEIRRRLQQKRVEASQALSEEFLDPSQMALNQQLIMQQLPSQQLQQTHLMQQQLMLQQQQLQLQSQMQQMQQHHQDSNNLLPMSTIPPSQPSSLVSHVEIAAVHGIDGQTSPSLDAANNAEEAAAPPAPGETTKPLSKGVTKEAIENAIAAAVIQSSTVEDNITDKESTVKFSDSVVTIDNNKTEARKQKAPPPSEGSKSMEDNVISSDQNLPDDAKIKSSESLSNNNNNNEDAPVQTDVNVNTNVNINKSSTTILEKNIKHDSSVLNIPSSKKRKNKMLEKKSIFTIAYDGMKTDQLRPDSASQEP